MDLLRDLFIVEKRDDRAVLRYVDWLSFVVCDKEGLGHWGVARLTVVSVVDARAALL